jgi:hypothetical protein
MVSPQSTAAYANHLTLVSHSSSITFRFLGTEPQEYYRQMEYGHKEEENLK